MTILAVEDDAQMMNCHECVCPRLPAVEEHQRSVNGSIKRIENTLEDQGIELKEGLKNQNQKIDGIHRLSIGILSTLATSSILLAVNILMSK